MWSTSIYFGTNGSLAYYETHFKPTHSLIYSVINFPSKKIYYKELRKLITSKLFCALLNIDLIFIFSELMNCENDVSFFFTCVWQVHIVFKIWLSSGESNQRPINLYSDWQLCCCAPSTDKLASHYLITS